MKSTCPKNPRSRRSRIFNSRILFVALAAFALLALLSVTAFMAQPVDPNPGSIFTSDTACGAVNKNIYPSKDAVYLNGGPKNTHAAAFPDGSYWVQVTDPSGATVLGKSTSADFIVIGGFVQGCPRLSDLVNSAGSSFLTPGYDDSPNNGGEYKVWVSSDSTFTNSNTKTDSFKVKTKTCDDPNCQPQVDPTLQVTKYYDANANGINDDNQPIEGWKIHIQDSIDFIRYTPVSLIVDADTYTVTEFAPVETNWLHTGCAVANNITLLSTGCTPGPDNTSVDLASGDNKTVEFGNLCLGAGGGLTLGFWSNKNGQGLTSGADLCTLTGMNLRNGSGGDFDPVASGSCPAPSSAATTAGKTALKNWLLSATATNMSYMLSAQLAAMKLNVLHGYVSGSALVYAPTCGTTGVGNNYITINSLIAAANAELNTHPSASSTDPWRAYQECLKNALDKANNNLNFVQAQPCPFTFAN